MIYVIEKFHLLQEFFTQDRRKKMAKNLTTQQIEKIQIDEGLIYLNFGETGETKLMCPIRSRRTRA